MATFINHAAIAAPRNGTTSHTVTPSAGTLVSGTLFTPTASSLLVCVSAGPVTSTTPTGWTLPTNGDAVNNAGLYVWYKTAAGSDTLVAPHGAASNYPVMFDFYEFAAGSTFRGVAKTINVALAGGAGPTLSGLTGTNWNAGVAGRSGLNVTGTTGGFSLAWNAGTEAVDYGEADGVTDGYQYGLTYLESAATSQAFAATFTNPGGSETTERLVISIAAVAPAATPTGAASGDTTWSGTAVGNIVASNTATGTTTWTGTSVGTNDRSGIASGAVAWSGTAQGPAVALSISAENALTGRNPDLWYTGVGSITMPAFARSSYYEPGQTAEFSVNYNSAFTFEIYRLGHYQDNGGRRVSGPTAGTPASQPSPVAITGGNGAVQCSAWSKNVTWAIPADITPGWYYVFLDGAGTDLGHILFCVTDKLAKKPILAVSGDATWHAAYNGFGGNNVYGATTGVGDIQARAYCSTYDKPVVTLDYVPHTHFFNASWASFKYLESLGVEVGYATVEQINNDPTILDGRDVIVFSGHNEYVPQRMVTKVKALLAAGQKIVNWAGNDFFWRVAFGSNTGFPTGNTTNSTGRTMWCRKDTMQGPVGSGHAAGTNFSTAADWTGTWQDTRWASREPSNTYLGDRFIANGLRNDSVKVPFSMKTSPLWRSCSGVQALTTGQEFVFGAGSLGMEWDMPDGSLTQVRLSSSSVNLAGNTADVNGEDYSGNGTWEHSISAVRSGLGIIFNFNSDQWGKTLDNMNIRHGNIANVNAQQACLNMFADLGVTTNSTMVAARGYTAPTPVTSLRTAYGLPDIPAVGYGSSGSWTLGGTAAGSSPNGGAASGSWSFAGSSTGQSNQAGAASGAWVFAGTSDGKTDTSGTSIGSWIFTGSSTGSRVSAGAANGSFTFTGSPLTGARSSTGSLTGAWVFTGDSAGRKDTGGNTTPGSWLFSGTSTGRTDRTGASPGSFSFVGSSTGASNLQGAAASIWAFSGNAIGLAPVLDEDSGNATGTFSFLGASAGFAPVLPDLSGTAGGSWVFTGSAIGKAVHGGASTGAWIFTSSSTGVFAPQGAASGTWVLVGASGGTTTRSGSSTGSWLFAGSSTGKNGDGPVLDFLEAWYSDGTTWRRITSSIENCWYSDGSTWTQI